MRTLIMPKSVVVSTCLILGILLLEICSTGALWCDRNPPGVNVPRTTGDHGFKIVISGDPDKPDKYIPGAQYTVRLQAPGTKFQVEKFSGFLLVAEPSDDPDASAGTFQLTSDSLARFSDDCPHAVKQASELPKAEVQVRWTAPAVASGCVSFRATIIKNKGQWFMDDGDLTKQLCPETEIGECENEEPEPCCACDEAKYELTFEGLWSPLTHPKDFPPDAWITHFSDIVGASHSPTFRFWQCNAASSDGLRQLAEAGDSKDLERELKDESGNIRTIIKARGLRHPNFFGHKTFAVFRADKNHNLISLVSKIAPSPDWFVGVSGLNLCLRNCSWVTSKVIPLYPWDAGTDSGVTYLSDKNPTIPRERIRRIVSEKPTESPFNDPSGNTVKPFARLRIQKQRAYERPCEYDAANSVPYSPTRTHTYPTWEDESSEEDKPECAVGEWGPWSSCSVSCGRGIIKRRRQYEDPKAKEYNCRKKLIQEEVCESPCIGGNGMGSMGGEIQSGGHPCAVTQWNPWGSCSKQCGQGIKRRRREFIDPRAAQSYSCNDKLYEDALCEGNNCNDQDQVTPGCETSDWGDWEACSVTICGRGSQIRRRVYADPARAFATGCSVSLMDTQTCTGLKPDCGQLEAIQEICNQPMDPGPCMGDYERWYFDTTFKKCMTFKFTGCKGNKNSFDSKAECEQTCESLKEINDSPSNLRVDCEVSDWGPWSQCSVSCGQGHKYRSRYIKVYPQNGGTPCPPKLEHRRKCTGRQCPTPYTTQQFFQNSNKVSSINTRHHYQPYGYGHSYGGGGGGGSRNEG